MEPSDNIKNIFQRYVDLKNRWELIKEKLSIPSELGDGFYFCILKRK